jgi:colanic acid biosynthesis glycosyl transferase WcaI
MMGTHVMLLTQFFHPDVSAIAQISTDLAEDLVALGFRVTVVAGRGTYLGGERLPEREEYRGIHIVRLQGTSLGKGNLAARLTDYVSFSASALSWLAFSERPDVLLAMSTPPFVPAIAAAMRVLRGVRFVYWAQDLYPELAVAFGLLGEGALATAALMRVSSWILRRADAVVTLGEAMATRLIKKGARAERVHVVQNWADPAAILPIEPAANDFRRAQGLEGKQVVLYSGNMGRSHDMETILEAADALRERSGLTFLFIGDGAKRALVEQAARANTAVRLLPYQPRADLSQSLSAGDLHVVTQDAQTVGMMEPSKLYGVMAVGRPVLFIGPEASEAAQTVKREGIGEVVANGDVRGASEAILRLLENGDTMGRRSRAALENVYGRTRRTAQFAKVLSTLARQ